MAGRSIVAVAATFGLAGVVGVTLGQFAITQPHRPLEANAIADQVGNPDASYGPPSSVYAEAARLNDAVAPAPVCKGCGPTLAQRRDNAFYGDTGISSADGSMLGPNDGRQSADDAYDLETAEAYSDSLPDAAPETL